MLVEQRHELLRNAAEAQRAGGQQHHHRGQYEPAAADGPAQGTAEAVVHAALEELALQLVGTRTTDEFLHEEDVLRNGQHPAQKERYGNDDEKRRQQLTRNVGRQIDRQEGEYGNERSTQQRHGRRAYGGKDGRTLAHAALHVDQRSVIDHNGIVHQHTHGNDDGRQRHALQGDARAIHIDKGAENGKDQSAANQYSVLHTDKEQ